jgi:phage anti-repressor protein
LIGAARSRLKDQDLKFEFVPLAEPIGSKEQAAEPPFSIAFYLKNLGGEDVNAVNARELWTKLESKRQFTDWIKQRIEQYDFVEGVDYLIHKFVNNPETGGRPTIDYFISLDMAKELSMVENNEQGKKARRYFIECEKQAKSKPRRIDHLSPEVISVLKQARTVQLAMVMGKQQASRYARELVFDRFGIDMELATTGSRNVQESGSSR